MITLANQIAEAWWSWMGAMLWQAGLLILIVGIIDLLIGKWIWPQVRYALWLLILVKLLIPPTWSLPTSLVSHSVPRARAAAVRVLGGEAGAGDSAATSSPLPTVGGASVPVGPVAGPAAAGPATVPLVWQVWVMGIWILGMALFLLLLAARIGKLRRWHREQEEKRTIPPWFHELLVDTARRIGLERLPAIVFSDEAVTPAVYGLFRPVLLLPADYTDSLSPDEAEHVLLHELAHLKRGDLWLHGLCLLLQIVYWFNPLLIWVRKQMRHVREICCDLTIASLLKEKTTHYRKTLLETARSLLTESLEPGMGLLGVFEEPFRLVARLRWLEKETWRNRGVMRAAALLVALLAVPLLLPMAAIEAGESSAAAREPAMSGRLAEGAGGSPRGDIYRRSVETVYSYFLIFTTSSEVRAESEFWIGERRAALVEENRTLVLDLEKNLFLVVNPRNRTYYEGALPLTRSDLLAEEVLHAEGGRLYSAQVEPTGETRKVQGLRCERYDVRQWEVNRGRRMNQTQLDVWATTEIPFDYAAAEQLLEHMRLLTPRDDKALRELSEIRGIQMRYERQDRPLFPKHRMVWEVVEMERRIPPPGLYSAPAGYVRVDRINPADF